MRRLGRGATRRRRCATCRARRALAGTAPALLESFDLSAGRALALRRAAREVASGRVDLRDRRPRARLAARCARCPGIGSWTVECLGLHGQGRFDQVPAGDLALRKLVGRLRTGDPLARAQEQEVREFFAPYAPWGGLAAAYAMRLSRVCSPCPGRNSLVIARPRGVGAARAGRAACIQAPNACQAQGFW